MDLHFSKIRKVRGKFVVGTIAEREEGEEEKPTKEDNSKRLENAAPAAASEAQVDAEEFKCSECGRNFRNIKALCAHGRFCPKLVSKKLKSSLETSKPASREPSSETSKYASRESKKNAEVEAAGSTQEKISAKKKPETQTSKYKSNQQGKDGAKSSAVKPKSNPKESQKVSRNSTLQTRRSRRVSKAREAESDSENSESEEEENESLQKLLEKKRASKTQNFAKDLKHKRWEYIPM